MKQLMVKGPKQTYLAEVEEPIITKPTQVKVRLKYCGVCMSEHYDWSVANGRQSFGHEPVGTVVEIGENVTGFKIGDRVSGLFSGNAQYVLADQTKVFKLPDNVSDE